MQNYIEVIVGAILKRTDGKILLIRQHKWEDAYSCFIGGHLEFQEEILDGLKREILEEVGISIDTNKVTQLLSGEYINKEKSSHLLFLNYLCELSGDYDVLNVNDEIQEVLWVPIPEAIEKVMQKNKDFLLKLISEKIL